MTTISNATATANMTSNATATATCASTRNAIAGTPRARNNESPASAPGSYDDDGDSFGSLLSDASRAGVSECDRTPGVNDDPTALVETAIDQPGDDCRASDDVRKHEPSRSAESGLTLDQALAAGLSLISPYPAVAPQIKVTQGIVSGSEASGSGSGQIDVIAATEEPSATVESIGVQPGRIPPNRATLLDNSSDPHPAGPSGDGFEIVAPSAPTEVALPASPNGSVQVAPETSGKIATQLNGEVVTELNGELATHLNGELATEPNGEVATEPNGEIVTEPNGELVTEPLQGSDPTSVPTDDSAIEREPDGAGPTPLVPASTQAASRPSRSTDGPQFGLASPIAAERGRQANIDEIVKQAAIRRLGTAGRLGIDISTDGLGSIRLEAAETSSGLLVNLGADRASTRAMLSRELGALRAELGAGHDVQVDLGARSDTPHGQRQPDRPSRSPVEFLPSGPVQPVRRRDLSIAPRRASIIAIDALDLRL